MHILDLFYYSFLAIFVATAIVTLGGVLQWPGFRSIKPEFLKALVTALLFELVGAVILTYQSLPTPGATNLALYKMEVVYERYSEDWLSLQPPETQQCLLQDQEDICTEKRQNLFAIKKVEGQTGVGDLPLTMDRQTKIVAGYLSYQFPGDSSRVSMQVSGRIDNELLRLKMIQPERVVYGSAGELILRPGRSLNFVFKPLPGNPNVYESRLYDATIGDEKLLIAKVSLKRQAT